MRSALLVAVILRTCFLACTEEQAEADGDYMSGVNLLQTVLKVHNHEDPWGLGGMFSQEQPDIKWKIDWQDCGDESYKGKVTGLSPATLSLASLVGGELQMSTTINLDEPADRVLWSRTYDGAKEGQSGDACETLTDVQLIDGVKFQQPGIECPVPAGEVILTYKLDLSGFEQGMAAQVVTFLSSLPKDQQEMHQVAYTKWHSSKGDNLACLRTEMYTEGLPSFLQKAMERGKQHNMTALHFLQKALSLSHVESDKHVNGVKRVSTHA